jgi:hypothetical protein
VTLIVARQFSNLSPDIQDFGSLFSVNNLYCSPVVIRAIKTRWAGHVARMGAWRGPCRVLVVDLREGDYLEDQNADGRIILKWIFKKWNLKACSGLSWLRIGTGGGYL